jgi:hypothetical protein
MMNYSLAVSETMLSFVGRSQDHDELALDTCQELLLASVTVANQAKSQPLQVCSTTLPPCASRLAMELKAVLILHAHSLA